MSADKHGMSTDDEFLVTAATRYTLGRSSYAVGIMTGIIKARAKDLSQETLRTIAKDIHDQGRSGYGCDCDFRDWMDALAAVEGALAPAPKKRGK